MRMMPLASIDPSLAIGFYCRTLGMPACCFHLYQLGLADCAGHDGKCMWRHLPSTLLCYNIATAVSLTLYSQAQ